MESCSASDIYLLSKRTLCFGIVGLSVTKKRDERIWMKFYGEALGGTMKNINCYSDLVLLR